MRLTCPMVRSRRIVQQSRWIPFSYADHKGRDRKAEMLSPKMSSTPNSNVPSPLCPVNLSLPRLFSMETPCAGQVHILRHTDLTASKPYTPPRNHKCVQVFRNRRFMIEGSMYSDNMLMRTRIFDMPETMRFLWCKHGKNCPFGSRCKYAHLRDKVA
jgi:hypothetical protein